MCTTVAEFSRDCQPIPMSALEPSFVPRDGSELLRVMRSGDGRLLEEALTTATSTKYQQSAATNNRGVTGK